MKNSKFVGSGLWALAIALFTFSITGTTGDFWEIKYDLKRYIERKCTTEPTSVWVYDIESGYIDITSLSIDCR